MTLHPPNVTFHERVEDALHDAQLHVALERATGRFTTLRADALASLPEAEAVRDRAGHSSGIQFKASGCFQNCCAGRRRKLAHDGLKYLAANG